MEKSFKYLDIKNMDSINIDPLRQKVELDKTDCVTKEGTYFYSLERRSVFWNSIALNGM